jgi:hypothetical protein
MSLELNYSKCNILKKDRILYFITTKIIMSQIFNYCLRIRKDKIQKIKERNLLEVKEEKNFTGKAFMMKMW